MGAGEQVRAGGLRPQGVCYVAFGPGYYEQCRASVDSLRAVAPELPVAICTDQGPAEPARYLEGTCARGWFLTDDAWFIDGADDGWPAGVQLLVVRDTPRSENRRWKIRTWSWTRFAKTLYLDTDTLVRDARFLRAFEWLESYDVMFGNHWRDRELSAANLGQYPHFRSAVNELKVELPAELFKGGCWLFRQTFPSVAFFELWELFWLKLGAGRDMPALMAAMAGNRERGTGNGRVGRASRPPAGVDAVGGRDVRPTLIAGPALMVGRLGLEYEHHGGEAWILHAASGHDIPGIPKIRKYKPDAGNPAVWTEQ